MAETTIHEDAPASSHIGVGAVLKTVDPVFAGSGVLFVAGSVAAVLDGHSWIVLTSFAFIGAVSLAGLMRDWIRTRKAGKDKR
jgi:hypothetical protein